MAASIQYRGRNFGELLTYNRWAYTYRRIALAPVAQVLAQVAATPAALAALSSCVLVLAKRSGWPGERRFGDVDDNSNSDDER